MATINKVYQKLINEDSNMKKSIFWYTAGNICNTASSVLLLMYVTRILGQNEAGVFSIAWAIAQLMFTVGSFSNRAFQVSDSEDKYKFKDYLTLKFLTSFMAISGGVVYSIALGNYGNELLVTFLLCSMFVGDIFADCFSGFFQKQEKLHIAGKSSVIRICLYNLTFLLMLLCFNSLEISIISALIVSVFWVFVFDYQIAKRITEVKISFNIVISFSLLKDCFPLFLSSFLTIFLINIPKNAINNLFTNDTQAIYNILFMPSALTNMFCMFIFVPLFSLITKKWHGKKLSEYLSLVGKILLMVVVVNICVLVGGYLLGVPLLYMFFGVDVSELKMLMMLLLLAGGFTSINNILNFTVAVMRQQKYIIIGYFVALVVSYLSVNSLIHDFALLGAALTYLLGISIVTITLVIINLIFIYRRYQQDKIYK
ncbi:MAG: lipopolysaccharide biosynthesis protein [Erysipelotrichaceae bacterium]